MKSENLNLTLYDTSKTEYMQSTSYPFGTLDGLYGISTQKIVKAFQRRFRRILVNGNVDNQTSKLLFSVVNSYKVY